MTEDVLVSLELDARFLDQIEALAKVDRRTLPDQTMLLLEKGICIFETQQKIKGKEHAEF
jgi:hypothetical protein